MATQWSVNLVPTLSSKGSPILGFEVYNQTNGNTPATPNAGVYQFAKGDQIRFLVWPKALVPTNSTVTLAMQTANGSPFIVSSNPKTMKMPTGGPQLFWWPFGPSVSQQEYTLQMTTGTVQFTVTVNVGSTAYTVDPEMTVTDG